MERDFTSECYEDFCTLVNQIKDDNWCGVTDWFGDLFLSLKHLLQDWGWLDRTTEMETYYRELLDHENISKADIANVFESISTLDSSFAGNGSGRFGFFREPLAMLRLCLSALTHVSADASRTGNLSTALSPSRLKALLEDPLRQLREHPLSGSLLTQPFSLLQLNDIPKEYMETYISTYEQFHADYAKELDEALSSFQVADAVKQYIKFLLYFGEEPYCSILKEIVFDAQKHYYQGKLLTALSFDRFPLEYIDTYVKFYDLLHPDHAAILNKALVSSYWTSDECQDVKFLTYCAPEPYRSIYFKYADRYKVTLFMTGSLSLGGLAGTSYFPVTKKVYLEDIDANFRDDGQGPYTSVFHENGHAVDNFTYRAEEDWGYLTHNYESNGKSLFDYIEEDVRNYVRNKIDEVCPALNEESKQKILVSLNLTDDSTYQYFGTTEGLSRVQIAYREMVTDAMYEDLRGEIDSSASDVFGGITNNAIHGDYGHGRSKDTPPEEYSYWYQADPASTATPTEASTTAPTEAPAKTPTENQCSELWAEFFAAKMTRNEEELASIKKHFPTAYPVLEEMARQMAAK